MFHRFGQSIREQRKQGASLGEFVLLDKTRFDIDIDGPGGQGTTILGCTLSSRVPDSSLEAVGLGINDFYYIDDWTVEQHTARLEEELEWLDSEIGKLQNTGRKVVVLTHYCSTSDQCATDPRHKSSPIQPGFVTELRDEPCFASGLAKLWAFGHTHYNCDFIDEQTGVRVLANQRGVHSRQAKGFEIGKIPVEL